MRRVERVSARSSRPNLLSNLDLGRTMFLGRWDKFTISSTERGFLAHSYEHELRKMDEVSHPVRMDMEYTERGAYARSYQPVREDI